MTSTRAGSRIWSGAGPGRPHPDRRWPGRSRYCSPHLERLGRVIACGPLGSGTVVKLVTSQIWFIHAAAIGDALVLTTISA